MLQINNFSVNKILNYLVILFAFSFPFFHSLKILILSLLILVWFFEGNFKEKYFILKNSKFFLIFSIFLLLLFISLYIFPDIDYHVERFWYANYLNATTYFIRHYIYYGLIIPILITSFRTKYFNYVVSAFIIGMFINEITSYLIFFELIHKVGTSKFDPVPFLHNHSIYGIYLSFTILVLLKFILDKKYNVIFLFYALFLLSATANLFINGGRIGYIIFLFVLLIFIFNRYKFNIKIIIGTISILCIILLFAFKYSNTFKTKYNQSISSIDNLYNKDNFSSSFGQRVKMWMIGYEIAKENYFIGVGLDDSRKAKNEIIDRKFKKYKYLKRHKQFHNQYIQILVEIGVLGLILFLLLFYLLYKETKYKELALIFIGTYLLGSMTEDTMSRQQLYIFFTFWAGILLSSKTPKSVI